ncbi:hypothetical protein OsJ_22435 [Oryza sativa Japonica Group]|nr:hypothetical protein OsJ_22435 [Oryza sativa Japonica Group]
MFDACPYPRGPKGCSPWLHLAKVADEKAVEVATRSAPRSCSWGLDPFPGGLPPHQLGELKLPRAAGLQRDPAAARGRVHANHSHAAAWNGPCMVATCRLAWHGRRWHETTIMDTGWSASAMTSCAPCMHVSDAALAEARAHRLLAVASPQ